MAKAREVFFNSEGRTTKGQLILLSLDGVDEEITVNEFEFTVIDLQVRADNPRARFENRRVIAKNSDTDNGTVVPFDSQEKANRLAKMITTRADLARAEQGKKKG